MLPHRNKESPIPTGVKHKKDRFNLRIKRTYVNIILSVMGSGSEC